MINKHEGNLLDLQEGIIVHGCNCEGRMGSGFAGQLVDKYPSVKEVYHGVEMSRDLFLGDIIPIFGRGIAEEVQDEIYKQGRVYFGRDLPDGLIVVHAMTQYYIAEGKLKNEVVVDYDAVAVAFAKVRMIARETKLPVHFPLIGCGLANGKWEEVSAKIELTLGDDVEKHLWIYNPK